MKKRAISLLSGGLDSLIATKLIIDQNIEVIGLHFASPFSSSKKKEGKIQAVRTAEELGIDLIIKYKGRDYLPILKNPKYGYGSNMNPCIDCRIYMLRRAKEIMIQRDASFIITGEVLGQRPMSQRKETLKLIEKEAGLEGLILRPLSARLLPETEPEKQGIVEREKLLSIEGRGRKIQFEYARILNFREFSTPASGCLLTDPNFSKRLKDLFTYEKDFKMHDVLLLKIGRHIRINEKAKFIVGRNEKENKRIETFGKDRYLLLYPKNFKGPKALFLGEESLENLKIGANILSHYGKFQGSLIIIGVKGKKEEEFIFERTELDIEDYII